MIKVSFLQSVLPEKESVIKYNKKLRVVRGFSCALRVNFTVNYTVSLLSLAPTEGLVGSFLLAALLASCLVARSLVRF